MDISKKRIWILGIISLIALITIVSLGTINHSLDLLISAGISEEILYLLLTLPIIGFFLAFSRIIIGINVQGASLPVLTIFSSFILGPLLTLEIFLIGIIFGYIAKFSILDLRLHFAVKVTLIMSFLSISFLFCLPIINTITPFEDSLGASIMVLGLLLVNLINDKYLNFKVTKTSIKSNMRTVVNTLIFAFISYFLLGGAFIVNNNSIHFSNLRNFISNYPDSVFIALILTVIIGSYTGLRVTEVFRFRKLIFKSK